MSSARSSRRRANPLPLLPKTLAAIILLGFMRTTDAANHHHYLSERSSGIPLEVRPVRWGPPSKRDTSIPLKISNNCGDTVWPAIASQAGTGPGTGGFALTSGNSESLSVGSDWQGRVWGRTNCSFNVAGNGASNLNGNNGAGRACGTGDCNGQLNCIVTVSAPDG